MVIMADIEQSDYLPCKKLIQRVSLTKESCTNNLQITLPHDPFPNGPSPNWRYLV